MKGEYLCNKCIINMVCKKACPDFELPDKIEEFNELMCIRLMTSNLVGRKLKYKEYDTSVESNRIEFERNGWL